MNILPVKYRADVDGMRAIAILSVLIFHTFPSVLPGGFTGVDIFFVISGYLISSAIFVGIDQQNFSFADFYARRIRRIFPALLLVLAFSFFAGCLILVPWELTRLGKHLASSATFTLNFVLVRATGYFDAMGERNPLLHLWSLCIEEQFYLVFPLLFLTAARLRLNRKFLILTIIALSFGFNLLWITTHKTATFYLPWTRFWELTAGGLLATLLTSKSISTVAKWSNFCGWLGLILVLGSVLVINKDLLFPGWVAIFPVIGACLLIAAEQKGFVNRWLAHPAMVWIGGISYPLYLWHYPILSYYRIYESGEPPVWGLAIAVAVAILLAWLTQRFIEAPIRFGVLRQGRSGRVVIGVLLAILIGFFVLGKFTQHSRGFPERIQNNQLSARVMPEERSLGIPCSGPGWGKDTTCIISDINRAPTAALIGDSHAAHYYPGAAAYVDAHRGNLIGLSGAGCVPLIGVRTRQVKGDPEYCGAFIAKVYQRILSEPTIQTVLLATRGPISLSGQPFGENDVPGRYIDSDDYPTASDQKTLFEQALDHSLMVLTRAHKQVVIILDNPEIGINPELCNTLPLLRKTYASCKIKRAEVDRRNAEYRELIATVLAKYPAVQVVDTFKALCDDQFCYGRSNGQMVYRDSNHLTEYGSRLIIPEYRF